MIAIYYVFLFLGLAIAGPFLLLKKKARAGLSQKFGFIPEEIKRDIDSLRGGIWIHAVSVGEFNAVQPLIKRLKEEHPHLPLLVSTTTRTGQELARERVGNIARIFYFPFDLPFASAPWLDALQPQLVAIAETELWPGFILECQKRQVKVISVNGRMSPKSFKTYHRLRFFFGQSLRRLSHLGLQSEGEALRYKSVGGIELPVTVTGNMKLDGLSVIDNKAVAELQRAVNVGADDFVVVAGSTHEGEEKAVIESLRRLNQQYSEAPNKSKLLKPRLVIAPRHPERFDLVCETVAAMGFTAKRHSRGERIEGDNDVYILDGLGQLAKFYSIASLAFVGGTLVPIGGHSLIEPYAYSVATCCGPHVEKTKDIANALIGIDALTMVQDEKQLADKLAQFHRNPLLSKGLGRKGKDWVDVNQGAVTRTLAIISQELGTTGSSTAQAHNNQIHPTRKATPWAGNSLTP